MVDRLDGESVGYIGLAFMDWDRAHAEADAVVRGRPASPHLMADALRAMLSWAKAQLSLREFGVRVRSDNFAIRFYEKLGFREVKRVPLRKHASNRLIRWEENASMAERDGPSLVHMRLGPD